MNQVVTKTETEATQDAFVSMIERVARDPSVDIDRLERLLDMQERIIARDAKIAYTVALSAMQPQLPAITENGEIKDRSGKVQSTYALWEDINEVIKPILHEHGFALNFRTKRDGDILDTTAVLSHKGGHSDETTVSLPIDMSGSKNGVQGVGSSQSYGQRYAATAILNLTSRGLDKDGQSEEPASVSLSKAAIDMCDNVKSLKDWNEKNRQMVLSLPENHRKSIVAYYQIAMKRLEKSNG